MQHKETAETLETVHTHTHTHTSISIQVCQFVMFTIQKRNKQYLCGR